MATAPWIIPPNYLGAMEAGSRLGLSERQQDDTEKSAADRLSLAYNQLAMQERASDERARLTLANTQAAQSLKARGLDLVGQKLQQQQDQAANFLQYRKDSLDERNRHNEATEGISQEKADNMIKRGDGKYENAPDGSLWIVQPSGYRTRVTSSRPTTAVIDAATGLPKTYTGSINDPALRAIMGTNAPMTSAAASLQATPSPMNQSAPQDGGEMVAVVNPQGKRVNIRKEQLSDALNQGYTQ